MKNQRIHTFYLKRDQFSEGPVDMNAQLHAVVKKENIENVKYIMQSATADGLYVSIVWLEKNEEDKVGF